MFAKCDLVFFVVFALAGASSFGCEEGENTVFQCQSGKKIVSLCFSEKVGSNKGALRYVFGFPGQIPELIYSNKEKALSEVFTFDYQPWAKGSRSIVTFTRGRYMYFVHVSTSSFPYAEAPDEAGVRVFRNGTEIRQVNCDMETVRNNMYQFLHVKNLPRYSEPKKPSR